jgi:hypothetical protein
MIGELCHVGDPKPTPSLLINILVSLENLVAYRALQLLDMLPKAVSLGMSDTDEPLKVFPHYLFLRHILTST